MLRVTAFEHNYYVIKYVCHKTKFQYSNYDICTESYQTSSFSRIFFYFKQYLEVTFTPNTVLFANVTKNQD